jgi:hypothetical protein
LIVDALLIVGRWAGWWIALLSCLSVESASAVSWLAALIAVLKVLFG